MWRYTYQDELYHGKFKYIDKFRKNGKWLYIYDKPKNNVKTIGNSYNAERSYNSRTNTVGKNAPSKTVKPVAPKKASSEYAAEYAYNSRTNQNSAKKSAAIPARPAVSSSNKGYSREEARNQSDVVKKPKPKSFMDKVGDWGRNAADDVGDAVGKAAKNTKNWAKNTADDVGDWGRKTADDVGKAASKAAKDTKNWVKNAAEDVGDWGKKAASDIGKAAKSAGNSAKKTAKDVYDEINKPKKTTTSRVTTEYKNLNARGKGAQFHKVYDTTVEKGKIDKAKDWVNDLFGKKKKKKKNYRVDRLK